LEFFFDVSIHCDFGFWNMTTCLWVSGSHTSNPNRPKSSESPLQETETSSINENHFFYSKSCEYFD